MKSVGHKVKAVPDSFMDGIKDGLVKVLGNRSASPVSQAVSENCKVAAGLDVEVYVFKIIEKKKNIAICFANNSFTIDIFKIIFILKLCSFKIKLKFLKNNGYCKLKSKNFCSDNEFFFLENFIKNPLFLF